MSDDPKSRTEPFDASEFDAFFRKAVDDDPEFPRPDPTSVVAWLDNRATPAQEAEVETALARSSRFRREIVDIADDLNQLSSPAVARAFARAKVTKVPNRQEFLQFRGHAVPTLWTARLQEFVVETGDRLLTPRLAMVAAALVLVLALPAYRGLVTLPQLESDLQDARDQDLSGPFRINVLASGPRSGGAEQSVRLHPGGSRLLLSVPVEPSFIDSNVPTYRIALSDATKVTIWSAELSTDDLRASLTTERKLNLAIPARSLSSGRYEVSIAPLSPKGAQAIVQIRFHLVRE